MNPSPAHGVKVLSEDEIQERLYGHYLGRRVPQKELPQRRVSLDVEWTGAEILGGELHRLRSELIALREEKEKLLKELSRPAQASPSAFPWKRLGVFVLAVLIASPVGARFLGASPGASEPTPYTVQVAVYDGRFLAERALQFLRELDYPAFLVEGASRGGTRRHFRIYVGKFVTKAEAHRERERLISDARFADAFVRIQ